SELELDVVPELVRTPERLGVLEVAPVLQLGDQQLARNLGPTGLAPVLAGERRDHRRQAVRCLLLIRPLEPAPQRLRGGVEAAVVTDLVKRRGGEPLPDLLVIRGGEERVA